MDLGDMMMHSMMSLDTIKKAAAKKQPLQSLNYLIRSRNQQVLIKSKARLNNSVSVLSSTGLDRSPFAMNSTLHNASKLSKPERIMVRFPSRKGMIACSKKFIVSKKIMEALRKQQEFQEQALTYYRMEFDHKEQQLTSYMLFHNQFMEALQGLASCRDQFSIIACLKKIKGLLNIQNEMPFVVSRILMEIGKLNLSIFRVQPAITCLLQAELMSRQSKNFGLTMQIIKELHHIYLDTDRVELAFKKALNLLHVAVRQCDDNEVSYALVRLGVCEYYQGNINKSCQYSMLAQNGLSCIERDNLKVNFCNDSRIFDLEKTLNNTDIQFREHFIEEREPSHFDDLVSPPEATQWLGRTRFRTRMVRPTRPPRQFKGGANTSQVFKMHKSYNRCWQNYQYVLSKKEKEDRQHFVPNHKLIRKNVVKTAQSLIRFCETIHEKVAMEINNIRTRFALLQQK